MKGTVYINDLILCDASRLTMLTDELGTLSLNTWEINALDIFFPGVGWSWRYGIVDIPPHPFDLVVKTESETILELYDCKFAPSDSPTASDDECVAVLFKGRNPWCHNSSRCGGIKI